MSKQDFTPPPPCQGLIGHRGVAALAPENTLSGFRLADKQGIDWIEFDVRLTKDNHLVIFHDDKLERTTNGYGYVYEHTMAALSTLDAGSWFDSRFKGEKIPQFVEVLPELISLKPYLNIELKVHPQTTLYQAQMLTTKLVDALRKHWPKTKPWPLISSFVWVLLWEVRYLMPELPIGFLQDRCTPSLIDLVAKTPNAALHCNYQHLDDMLLASALERDIPVLVYTVNEPEIAKKLLQTGIFGLFSDNPLSLLNTSETQP